ncbi:MAG TPA: hypothetical protein PK147_07470, partial [Saprospiraceae bacterium]|nr:hypothetical protein [Saprospiraceae bacterium]
MNEQTSYLQNFIASNPAIVLNKNRMKGLFNDIFQNDLSKVNLMMTAYDVEIVDELCKMHPMDVFSKNRLVKVLVQQYSIVEDKARWAIETWISCFNNEIITEIKKIELLNNTIQSTSALEEPTIEMEGSSEHKLRTREDYDNYYVNPKFEESPKRIYIPCGIGNTDNGFFIYG